MRKKSSNYRKNVCESLSVSLVLQEPRELRQTIACSQFFTPPYGTVSIPESTIDDTTLVRIASPAPTADIRNSAGHLIAKSCYSSLVRSMRFSGLSGKPTLYKQRADSFYGKTTPFSAVPSRPYGLGSDRNWVVDQANDRLTYQSFE